MTNDKVFLFQEPKVLKLMASTIKIKLKQWSTVSATVGVQVLFT